MVLGGHVEGGGASRKGPCIVQASAVAQQEPKFLGYDVDGTAIYVSDVVDHVEKAFKGGIVRSGGESYRGEPAALVDYPGHSSWLNRLSKMRKVQPKVVAPVAAFPTPVPVAPTAAPAPSERTLALPASTGIEVVIDLNAVTGTLRITAGPNGTQISIE